MKRRSRVNYSVAQRSEIWDRWQAGPHSLFNGTRSPSVIAEIILVRLHRRQNCVRVPLRKLIGHALCKNRIQP